MRIINTVIGHFINNIPEGRDPKDFIRSSYRTRDSSDIYIALRLPVLRKLLDVNTRKAFRDILDLHGGNLAGTRLILFCRFPLFNERKILVSQNSFDFSKSPGFRYLVANTCNFGNESKSDRSRIF